MSGRSVLYNIKSKDETKAGVTSAIKGLERFNKKVGSVQSMLKNAFIGGAVVAGLVALKNKVDNLTDAFGVQQKAELLLSAAAKNNPLINGQAVKNLTAYASQLQKNSVYGDEQIIQYETWLTTQGKNEEQIKKIMSAAADLASSGLMPLESAVKNISKTYAGMAGELGESIPELRTLTAEQMKNGAAVDLIAEKYAGLAKAYAESAEGQKIQLENIKGDIKESLGEIFKGITGDFNSKMIPILSKINDWLSENKARIINFFRNFPAIAKASFQLSKDFLKTIFSLDFLKALGSFMWEVWKTTAKTEISVLFNYLKAIGSTIWEPLKYGFDLILYGIKSAFATAINFFIDKINDVWKGAHDAAELLKHPLNPRNRETFTGGIAKIMQDLEKPQNTIKENITDAWKTANENTKQILQTAFDNLSGAFDAFQGNTTELQTVFDNYIDGVKEVLNTPLKVEPVDSSNSAGNANTSSTPASSGTPFLGLTASLVTGDMVNFGKGLISMVQSVSSLKAAMDPLGIVVQGILNIIGPSLNKILNPLIGILAVTGEVIGQQLAPILEWLVPITEAIGLGFIDLYNKHIRVFANGIIAISNIIYNAIVIVANWISGVVEFFTGQKAKKWDLKNVVFDTLKEINSATLSSKAASYSGDYVGNSNAGGTTASYTGVRDINVYVNYQVGISAQDDRDIALKIRNEIRAAEALGY